MTSEPKSLFVWIWLPGQSTPVVAGQVVRNEDTDVIHFRLWCMMRSWILDEV